MKRMWLGIGILTVILVIGILISGFFSALHLPIAAELEQAVVCAAENDWAAATERIYHANETWRQYRHCIAAIADHEPVEQIDADFARLFILCDWQEEPEFSATAMALSRQTQAMANSQQIHWWDLL